MGMLRGLPKRARLEDRASGMLKTGQYAGTVATVARYVVPLGFADGGTEYVTVVCGDVRRCFRYSGRNRQGATIQLAQFRAAMDRGEVGE